MGEAILNLSFERDKDTDVMFVDIKETKNPIDTITGPEDILIHIDMNTGEVVGFRIINWKAFHRRMIRYHIAFSVGQALKKGLAPLLQVSNSISHYYLNRNIQPKLN